MVRKRIFSWKLLPLVIVASAATICTAQTERNALLDNTTPRSAELVHRGFIGTTAYQTQAQTVHKLADDKHVILQHLNRIEKMELSTGKLVGDFWLPSRLGDAQIRGIVVSQNTIWLAVRDFREQIRPHLLKLDPETMKLLGYRYIPPIKSHMQTPGLAISDDELTAWIVSDSGVYQASTENTDRASLVHEATDAVVLASTEGCYIVRHITRENRISITHTHHQVHLDVLTNLANTNGIHASLDQERERLTVCAGHFDVDAKQLKTCYVVIDTSDHSIVQQKTLSTRLFLNRPVISGDRSKPYFTITEESGKIESLGKITLSTGDFEILDLSDSSEPSSEWTSPPANHLVYLEGNRVQIVRATDGILMNPTKSLIKGILQRAIWIDEQRIAVFSDDIKCFDPLSAEVIGQWDMTDAMCLNFPSPKQRYFAAGMIDNFKIYHTDTPELAIPLQGTYEINQHPSPTYFSESEDRFAALGTDGVFREWSLRTGTLQSNFQLGAKNAFDFLQPERDANPRDPIDKSKFPFPKAANDDTPGLDKPIVNEAFAFEPGVILKRTPDEPLSMFSARLNDYRLQHLAPPFTAESIPFSERRTPNTILPSDDLQRIAIGFTDADGQRAAPRLAVLSRSGTSANSAFGYSVAWEASTGLHSSKIAFSPKGSYVAICQPSHDHRSTKLVIYDGRDGTVLHNSPFPSCSAESFSPDERWLLLSTQDGGEFQTLELQQLIEEN